ncbi:serine/threonine-protein kinase [Thalassoglobus sp. JC818]|uniref:serine/threonine protein kinase n=1 Tax=Thalassoglobus sp. JC818 TaxID=3232136 RepID=UPI003459053B
MDTTASGISGSGSNSNDALSQSALPTVVGPYFIEKKLGAGGMGTVYLGRHKTTQELAAVKVLPASMAHEAGFVARFDREIVAMRKLNSSCIVELYESGEADGTYYYAMEFVDGETVTELLERHGRIPWRQVVEIGVQICTALKAAHNAGIIHRDLKPSNLLIDDDGQVKLTDFGVAQVFASGRLTVTGGVLGTAEYMSPEQAQGKRATKASDIYSLGAVLYVMLTGRPPFQGKTVLDILQKHRYSQFDSVRRVVPEVPVWLDEIVCKCLAKKPEDRYPDAYVLSLRLQEVPRKVDFREEQLSQFQNSVTEETIADPSQVSRPQPEAIGGTLVRDLFRAHFESEQQGSIVKRFLDNPWVLLSLLAIMLIGGYAWTQSQQMSEEDKFTRGVELMSRPEGPVWEAAGRDFFEPLVEADPERWQPEVDVYLRQIEVYRFKKKLLGRDLGKVDVPTSEPEAIIRQALEMRSRGQLGHSREMLVALRSIVVGDPEHAELAEVLDQMVSEIESEAHEQQFEFVEKALTRANTLFEKGEVDQALEIWLSVKSLYDQHPDVQPLVQRAEASYLLATGVDLNDAVRRPADAKSSEIDSKRDADGPQKEDPKYP